MLLNGKHWQDFSSQLSCYPFTSVHSLIWDIFFPGVGSYHSAYNYIFNFNSNQLTKFNCLLKKIALDSYVQEKVQEVMIGRFATCYLLSDLIQIIQAISCLRSVCFTVQSLFILVITLRWRVQISIVPANRNIHAQV